MYKVLLVDDERIILDGIAKVVDWEAGKTQLAGTARNGLEALEKMEEIAPDIIISDIRMPGMDGLELAARVAETYPDVRMILLSGFSEFGYAQTAMQYGVKHYLLKPCNEVKIVEALLEVGEELTQSRQKEQFITSMREGMQRMLPHVKEQVLKEFVTNKTYGQREWDYYRQLLGLDLDNRKVRLILFQLEGAFEFEHLFAVKNIGEEILGNTVLSSTVGEHVLIVVEDSEAVQRLHDKIGLVRDTFLRYYRMDLTAALSDSGDMTKARKLYKQTVECLHYRFYLGEGSLITRADVEQTDIGGGADVSFEEDKLLLQIKAGDRAGAENEIDALFHQLAGLRSGISVAKSYVIQWFMAMIRLGDPEALSRYMERLVHLTAAETLQTAQSLFKDTALEITQRHYETNKSKQSAVVDKVIEIIATHLADPELSLGGVAHQMLYMNSDYLGKLFKKETGEKFSNYVMKMRINKATELLERNADIKVFELAEQLGFGDNPQYFSQVFKKYVGCTPSEYMKST